MKYLEIKVYITLYIIIGLTNCKPITQKYHPIIYRATTEKQFSRMMLNFKDTPRIRNDIFYTSVKNLGIPIIVNGFNMQIFRINCFSMIGNKLHYVLDIFVDSTNSCKGYFFNKKKPDKKLLLKEEVCFKLNNEFLKNKYLELDKDYISLMQRFDMAHIGGTYKIDFEYSSNQFFYHTFFTDPFLKERENVSEYKNVRGLLNIIFENIGDNEFKEFISEIKNFKTTSSGLP